MEKYVTTTFYEGVDQTTTAVIAVTDLTIKEVESKLIECGYEDIIIIEAYESDESEKMTMIELEWASDEDDFVGL